MRRREIIAAQPHLVTASGEELGIHVGERKVEKLEVSFHPVQTGSGTPSPSNPRPVVGWSSIPVSIVPGSNDALVAVPAGLYGTVDLSTGIMTVTHKAFSGTDLTNIDLNSTTNSTTVFQFYFESNNQPRGVSGTAFSNRFSREIPSGTAGRLVQTESVVWFVVATNELSEVSAAGGKAWLTQHPTEFVYELKTTQTIQLSGITPRTGTVTISPFQQGGGTASPTNLRPIIPVAGGASAVLSGTNYGGTLDLVSGEGLATWNKNESAWTDSSAFSSFTKSGDYRIFWIYLGGAVYNDDPLHILSDQYTFAGYGYDYSGVPVYSMCGSPDYTGSLWVKVPASDLPTDNLAGAQAFFQQTLPKFYWPRTVAGRTAISTTPQTILAPRGQQTVSSPAGDVEISYWAQDDTAIQFKKYIVTTGDQYIETGFVPQPGDEFTIDFIATTKQSYQVLASAGTGSVQFIIMPTTDLVIAQGLDPELYYESYWRYFSSGDARVLTCDARYGTPYTASATGTGTLTINERSVTKASTGALDGSDTTLWLGMRRNGKQGFYGNIGETTVTRNGAVVLHCVPAVIGGVAGMYETVSKRFLTNQGTGTITTI